MNRNSLVGASFGLTNALELLVGEVEWQFLKVLFFTFNLALYSVSL